MRLWFEVSKNKSIYETDNFDNDKTWYPINKGGGYRKWYGNNEYVINWKIMVQILSILLVLLYETLNIT